MKKYCQEKSLKLAQKLFPISYKTRQRYRTYHYAFGYIGKKLIGIGSNIPERPNAKALYFGKRFNIEQFKDYPHLHAEIDLLARLWGRYHIDGDLSIYLVRLNRFGEQQNSKPCSACQEVLDALGISEIFWTPF